MCAYLHSPHRIESAHKIVAMKIAREGALLRRYGRKAGLAASDAQTIEDVLLWEARAAKHFWKEFRALLPLYPDFEGRSVRAQDPVNRLLDIGYHHLAGSIQKILTRLEIPTALGIIHAPHAADSAPLVYDLMELFRADTINTELLRFLRLKKKRIDVVDQTIIGHFLHEVNERMDRMYYLRDFHACQSYRYYMELQILKFISAVNHRQTFSPVELPTRHDSRCRPLDKTAEIVVQSSPVTAL